MQKLELFGCLTKVENLWCLEKIAIPNTCILESFDVFRGYYGNAPQDIKPKFVYIVTDETYNFEQILRFAAKVKQKFPHDFNAAHAEITVGNKTCSAVRITGLEDYSEIKKLQEEFKNCGFALKKKVRDIENTDALIKITKIFKLEAVGEDMFIDTRLSDIGYFIVDNDLTWEQFASKVKLFKSSWTGASFDAAKCFVVKDKGIIDMVRIFRKGLKVDFLEKLKNCYNNIGSCK